MADKVEKQRYKCTSCSFKFSRHPDEYVKAICPFCGKQSVVKDVPSEAQKLLDDAEKWGNLNE